MKGPTTIDNFWEKSEAGLDVSDFPMYIQNFRGAEGSVSQPSEQVTAKTHTAEPSESSLLLQSCMKIAAEVKDLHRQVPDCITDELVEGLLSRAASAYEASTTEQIALHVELAECNGKLKLAIERKRVADFLSKLDDL